MNTFLRFDCRVVVARLNGNLDFLELETFMNLNHPAASQSQPSAELLKHRGTVLFSISPTPLRDWTQTPSHSYQDPKLAASVSGGGWAFGAMGGCTWPGTGVGGCAVLRQGVHSLLGLKRKFLKPPTSFLRLCANEQGTAIFLCKESVSQVQKLKPR